MKTYTAWKMIFLLGLTVLSTSGCGQRILAGTDYLKTAPDTSFDLPLPGGTQTVKFVGNPRSGNAFDTAITRLDDVKVKPGQSGKTRLKMIELSLKSEQPVQINGQPYNVLVSLDPNKPSTGTMTITEKTKGSGTFTSSFDPLNFVVSFDPVGSGAKLPDVQMSNPLINTGEQEEPVNGWISNPQQANPPCTTVSPKPKSATDTNSHTGKGNNDLDIFPNGKINENHKNTSRWHRAACI